MKLDNQDPTKLKSNLSGKQQFVLMLFPVVLFSVVEEYGGLTWALALSVLYAFVEFGWEWFRYRKLSKLTLFSNLMVIGLSGVSFLTQDGLWFKLQPAILEFIMAIMLIGSFILKKPLLVGMMEQQGHSLNEMMRVFFNGLTFRMGLFFLFQSGLAVVASIHWSTEVWAFLKSIGILIMMVLYMLVEVFIFRKKLSNKLNLDQKSQDFDVFKN